MNSVEQFKTYSKKVLKAYKAKEPWAVRQLQGHIAPNLVPTLQRVQHVNAVTAGFVSWKSFLDASDVEQRLAFTMLKEPYLNHDGIRLYEGHRVKPIEEQRKILELERKDLISSIIKVEWVMSWLRSNIAPIKSINRKTSSYGLKHIAEKKHPDGHISNGVLIAAAISCGYEYTRIGDSLSVWFSMSENSIKRMRLENASKSIMR